MHIVISRELPHILLTETLCSGQIIIRPGLVLCKAMFHNLSPPIWPTRLGQWKVHCRQKVLCRLHITAGLNLNRHDPNKPPAAPCLLINNGRHLLRRTICIWALLAEAALAGISVLTQPTPAFFLFSPKFWWNQSQTEEIYNERLLLLITWRPCRIQKMWSFV